MEHTPLIETTAESGGETSNATSTPTSSSGDGMEISIRLADGNEIRVTEQSLQTVLLALQTLLLLGVVYHEVISQ